MQGGGVLHFRVGGEKPSEERVIDAPVHVDQPDFVEHFVASEAAVGVLPDDRVVRVGHAVGKAPFAECFVGHRLQDGAIGVGHRGDASEAVAVQVLGGGRGDTTGGGGLDDGDRLAIDVDEGALFGAAVELGVFLEEEFALLTGVEVDRRALGAGDLFDALVFGSVEELVGDRALDEFAGHDEAGVDLAAALVGNDVAGAVALGLGDQGAVGVVDEVDVAAAVQGDLQDGVRVDVADRRVGVGADVTLAGDAADGVVGEALGDKPCPAGVDGGAGEPVEAVVEEGFGEALGGVAATGDVAEAVVLVGEVLDGVAGTALDGGGPPAGGVVALGGLQGVAVGLLAQVATRLPLASTSMQLFVMRSSTFWRTSACGTL